LRRNAGNYWSDSLRREGRTWLKKTNFIQNCRDDIR
jgi:hypothetical protein